MIDITLLWLLLNGIFTIACGLIISYYAIKERVSGSIFHYTWAAGFLVYGIEIFLRAHGFPPEIVHTLFFSAFILFVVGIWQLCKAKQFIITFSIAIVFLFLAGVIVYFGLAPRHFLQITSYTVLFLFVAIPIFQHRMLFGKSTDRLLIGWILLYTTNITQLLLSEGTSWVVDAFAVIAKIIILFGVLDYDFVVIADKARVKKFPAPEVGYGQEGKLILLTSAENSNVIVREANWLKKKTAENVNEETETAVFVFQDVFPYKELRAIKWINPEKVSVYLFSSSAQKAKSEFIVLPMGLAQIGAALSQVTLQSQKAEKGYTVIFLHLSLLIQVFGTDAVYNMLLNKMGYIRENGINLYAFFYPTIHSDPATVSLFTRLADETAKL
ncbi:MAG: hypothetical protein LBI79_09755 [Nitrososphaerota archaeon]|nr:hypothetical protein [Nitrososphaerota archaeon]